MGGSGAGGTVRRRTALTDMVPHAARRLPVLTLTAAPMLLEPMGQLPPAPEGYGGGTAAHAATRWLATGMRLCPSLVGMQAERCSTHPVGCGRR
jgi:hypothetical protein